MTLNNLIEKYKEYVESEWEEDASEELTKAVEETKIFDLMYTTINDNEWEVQVSDDLKTQRMSVDEWDVQVSYDFKTQKMSVEISNDIESYIYKESLSLEEFYEELETANFGMYYSYAHHICEEKFSLDLEW